MHGQQNFKKPCYELANLYWKSWDIINETTLFLQILSNGCC